MDTTQGDLEHLFQQLGLQSDANSIEGFVRKHQLSEGYLFNKLAFGANHNDIFWQKHWKKMPSGLMLLTIWTPY